MRETRLVKTDLLLLERLLNGLRDVDDNSVGQAEAEFAKLYSRLQQLAEQEGPDAPSPIDFEKILDDNSELCGAAKVGMAKSALKFVEAELEQLDKTKKTRPLTEFEQSYALTCLLPMLGSIGRLFPDDEKVRQDASDC